MRFSNIVLVFRTTSLSIISIAFLQKQYLWCQPALITSSTVVEWMEMECIGLLVKAYYVHGRVHPYPSQLSIQTKRSTGNTGYWICLSSEFIPALRNIITQTLDPKPSSSTKSLQRKYGAIWWRSHKTWLHTAPPSRLPPLPPERALCLLAASSRAAPPPGRLWRVLGVEDQLQWFFFCSIDLKLLELLHA